jgi:hypothetical protein
MLAHLVSGRWGDTAGVSRQETSPNAVKRGWFSRLLHALFGK